MSLLRHRSTRVSFDTPEGPGLSLLQRQRSNYDEKIRTLMKIGHIERDEMESLIEQLKNAMKGDDCKNESQSEEQNENEKNDSMMPPINSGKCMIEAR